MHSQQVDIGASMFSTLLMDLNKEIDHTLESYLDEQDLILGSLPNGIGDDYRAYLLTPGKRVRPLFVLLGWCSAGEDSLDTNLINLCVSLELFHVFALIHDDVMDQSDFRRGRPTLQERIGTRVKKFTPKQSDNISVLLGDLTLTFSDNILDRVTCCGESGSCIRYLYTLMRIETMYGQALDLSYENDPASLERQHTQDIIEYKTSSYTMWRPFQLGAHLVGRTTPTGISEQRACTLLGNAYQLIDDMWGSLGPDENVQKPGAIDIIDGKPTELLRLTYELGSTQARSLIENIYSKNKIEGQDIIAVKELMWSTGAVQQLVRTTTEMLTVSQKEFHSSLQNKHLFEQLDNIFDNLRMQLSQFDSSVVANV